MKVRSTLPRILQGAAHLLGWVLVALVLNSLLSLQSEEIQIVNGVEHTVIHTQSLLPYIIISLAVKAGLVYGYTLWIFPGYFKKKKISAGLGLVLLLLVAAIVLEYLGYALINSRGGFDGWESVQVFDEQQFEITSLKKQLHENPFSFWNMALYVLGFAIAFAWFLVRDWNVQEKQLRELRQLQTSTELNFLKLQINPHFLFNTLNNLFSVAQKNNDEETARGIAKLAELMRYLLHESNKALIPLEQELQYIHSYIELAKMRYADDEVEVVFEVQGEVKNRSIPPLLLIPFVENAFKHGIRVGSFSRIVLSLDLSDSQLIFTGNNPDHAAANYNDAQHTGIGLENVRKRIALLYPENSHLTFATENGVFYFRMTLAFGVF